MFKKNLLMRTAGIGFTCAALMAYLVDQSAAAASLTDDPHSLNPHATGDAEIENLATGTATLFLVRDAVLGGEFSTEPVWTGEVAPNRISSPYYSRRQR